jgi:FkbM family methyltransferase
MKNLPRPSYRLLFWLAMTCGMILAALLLLAMRRADLLFELVGDPRFFSPHKLSACRDVDYPFTIEVYGYKYKGTTGDYIDDYILTFGAYEKDILFFMRDYIQARNNPDAIFLDVGACEGQHSLFMSRHVKQVHAFEPFPPVADRFRSLIDLNGFTNIQLHQVGLGEKEGLFPFVAPEADNMGGGSFAHGSESRPGKLVGNFRVVAGDEWLAQFGVTNVEMVKIDVEGFEQFVLEGLAGTLKRDRPVLVIEVTQPPSGTIGSASDLRKCFPENYEFQSIHDGGDTGSKAITGQYKLQPIGDLFAKGPIVMVVAYPKEKGALIGRGKS